MLILQPSTQQRWFAWRPGAMFAIMRDDSEIGRVNISGAPKRDGEARILLGQRRFECRIHITGKAHWNYVPSRWAMYSGNTVLHGATWESGKSFLTEREEGQEPIWLRRERFGGAFMVERASDRQPVGEIKWVRPRLVPKSAGPRIVSDISLDLSETFEVLLLWIFAQDDYRNSD